MERQRRQRSEYEACARTHRREGLAKQLQQVDLVRVERVSGLADDVRRVECRDTLEERGRHAELTELRLEGMRRRFVVDQDGTCKSEGGQPGAPSRMPSGQQSPSGCRAQQCRAERTCGQFEPFLDLVPRPRKVLLLERLEPIRHDFRRLVGEEQAAVALEHLPMCKESVVRTGLRTSATRA